MTATDYDLIVDIAAFTKFDVRVNQHTPSMVMKACTRANRSLRWKNTVEKDIQDNLNYCRYERNPVEEAPTCDGMKL